MSYIFPYILVAILLPLTIIWYGKIRCDKKQFKDPLEERNNMFGLDGWSISHFVSFFISGLFFPQYYFISFICGCLWELSESLYGYLKPGWMCDNDVEKLWWYGKVSDIFVNGAGLYAGVYMSNIIRPHPFFVYTLPISGLITLLWVWVFMGLFK